VNGNLHRTWLRASALVTVVDAMLATVLSVMAYGQPFGRVCRGVADARPAARPVGHAV
jgi:hypothetical protein